jgi:Zn finger protein HypA/HybF involved in hydrogenase expression
VKCADCGEEFVADVPGEPCPKCGSSNVTVDPDEIPVYTDDDDDEFPWWAD